MGVYFYTADIRAAAAKALGKFREPGIIEELKSAAKDDSDYIVKAAAAKALREAFGILGYEGYEHG